MRVPRRALTVTGGIAAALACASLATAAAAAPTVISRGHVDVVGVEVEGGAFQVHVHDEAGGAEHAPADVVLEALPGAAYTVPGGSCHAFLGSAGDTVHRLPQVQDADLLWAGLSAHIDAGVLENDTFTLSLDGVSGPGDFSVYQDGLCATDTRLFDSGDGIDASDTTELDAHSHLHANWAFTEPGTYTVSFTVSGSLADGTPLPSVTEDYTFSVLP
ncbi:choice-of-anchor M domain-containing protein [Streptomyces sp. MP131-18]|uniref:choice-of-anchor M domain-containing protein n=1 Tax=Streptomyces sp. MP131-18 TaxID=1857892 RepID=UPI0009D37057|nr:choice-of-anchor M domain-containing protein [Streptomyces sp. MP131-18]ONK09730.1 putative ABC transporter-associated repeat protein [Streptomyces sp. MP131-18]